MNTKPWAEDQNSDPSFLADIWQVMMIAAFTIAILFMFLGNTIPLDGERKPRAEIKQSPKIPVETEKKKTDPKESPPIQQEEKKKITSSPEPKNKKIPETPIKKTVTKKPPKSIKTEKKDKLPEDPFSLVFETNAALFSLMKKGKVRLFIMTPSLNLQYQAMFLLP